MQLYRSLDGIQYIRVEEPSKVSSFKALFGLPEVKKQISELYKINKNDQFNILPANPNETLEKKIDASFFMEAPIENESSIPQNTIDFKIEYLKNENEIVIKSQRRSKSKLNETSELIQSQQINSQRRKHAWHAFGYAMTGLIFMAGGAGIACAHSNPFLTGFDFSVHSQASKWQIAGVVFFGASLLVFGFLAGRSIYRYCKTPSGYQNIDNDNINGYGSIDENNETIITTSPHFGSGQNEES